MIHRLERIIYMRWQYGMIAENRSKLSTNPTVRRLATWFLIDQRITTRCEIIQTQLG